jgi:ATP/maltotriose-dependent transcriptional regulator MalT
MDPDATLDDLREAVRTLEETERIARRTLGSAHPLAAHIKGCLQAAREMLRSA